jgi:hypothetical protein
VTTTRTIQQRFTQGELDPQLLGRSDIDQYYSASETMENVIGLTQGGYKRRGGLEHIDEYLRQLTFLSSPTITASNGGTTANANDRNTSTSLTTTTNISTTNPYVVAHYDFASAQTIGVVYITGLALTVSGSSSEFFLQGSNDNSSWTSIGSALSITTTAKNYSRRVEASYRYIRLARIGATDLTTNRVTFVDMNAYTNGSNSNTKLIDFEFNSEQAYMLALSDKNIAVYKDGVLQVDIYAGELTSARLGDINWAQSADTLIIFHEDVNPQLIQRQGSDDYWTISNLSFDNVPYHAFTETVQTGSAAGLGTLTPSAVSGTVKLTIGSGSWPSGKENQYVEGNGGRARILSGISSTEVNAYVEIPFYNTDAIAATDWEYITGYEATWSVTRGWPICGSFHNGRLWIGGSKQRPTTAWGSRVALYYDFDPGTALDDEGIEITLDTDQLNRITNIYSGRNLMIYTTGAEFIIPQTLNEPITPSNVSTSRQSRIGSQRGLRVQEIEGGVFYIQNGGQSIQEFIFSDTQQAYTNNLISLLSGHLVRNPVDFALRRATSVDDGALLLMVRENGEATIGTIQRAQKINCLTNQTTDGSFLACGADYNDIYFTVQRTINGTARNYLERLNEDHYLDASKRYTTGLPATTFTGLSHIEAETARVIADDSVLSNETVSSGSATIDRAAEEYCEIGLWFQPIQKDLPFEIPPSGFNNTVLGKLLNISEVVIRLYETRHVKINGKTITFRGFGSSGGDTPLDTPPPLFSGIRRLQGWRGWDTTAQVTVTQDQPGPLTVLALSKRVTFDG